MPIRDTVYTLRDVTSKRFYEAEGQRINCVNTRYIKVTTYLDMQQVSSIVSCIAHPTCPV